MGDDVAHVVDRSKFRCTFPKLTALFISQCREGNNVFEAEINSDGFTAAAMASLALGAVLPIDSMLSSDAISSQIDLSSVDDEFSALTNFDFSAINVVGVDTVTMPFDFADLRSQLVTTMTSLSPVGRDQ